MGAGIAAKHLTLYRTRAQPLESSGQAGAVGSVERLRRSHSLWANNSMVEAAIAALFVLIVLAIHVALAHAAVSLNARFLLPYIACWMPCFFALLNVRDACESRTRPDRFAAISRVGLLACFTLPVVFPQLQPSPWLYVGLGFVLFSASIMYFTVRGGSRNDSDSSP